ncbi:MAG: nuclear transport factor 2 family protein [Actinobacteria bacterium]|nr:nuclear transport factor 2 family protein [Actinomycetota bacterium]
MLTTAELAAWLDRYGAAWEGLDPDTAAALFTTDARYHESPYAEPFQGAQGVREYWARVTADQMDVVFSYEVVGIAGEVGMTTWNSKLTAVSSGARVELDGVFLLEFEGEECSRLREWWHVR